MATCIYSRQGFGSVPKEHILQNVLGARWTSSSIVCGDVQESFGVTIDVALARALQPIRNMFGTASGRGNPHPVLRGLQASSDEMIDLDPGCQPWLHEPVVQVTRRSECRFDVHIKLDNFAQLGWAAHLLKLQLPQASIDESMLRAAATPVQALNRWC